MLVLGHTRIKVAPGQLGMRLPLDSATQRALTVSPGTILGLRAGVDKPSVKAYVARLAKRYDRTVRNPELKLRGLKPYVSKPGVGRVLSQRAISAAIQSEVIHGTPRADRREVEDDQADDCAAATFGPVVVIQRSSNLLTLYKNTKFVRRFHVATGQAIYPTPLGRFNDHRQVEGPVVVPAERRVGRRREADAARARQPARHALDGARLARRRDPRHARVRLDRLLGCRTAASAC